MANRVRQRHRWVADVYDVTDTSSIFIPRNVMLGSKILVEKFINRETIGYRTGKKSEQFSVSNR